MRKKTNDTIHDKEDLYEETIKLRQHTSAYQEENVKLKNIIGKCEKEIENKDRILQDLLAQMAPRKLSVQKIKCRDPFCKSSKKSNKRTK